ncbi:MAG: hypothetical protein MRY32_07640 [Rickettsiales bacterium]|nr:hypothetical protein [Rickettsiales bacterium]
MAASKTSPLDEASARLSAAFERLESASVSASAVIESDVQTDLDELKKENARLSDENSKLSNQLQALQKEHVELQDVANKVADKIDDQVEQLDLVMMAQA